MQGHTNSTIGWRVFDGVIDQIIDKLIESLLIAINNNVIIRQVEFQL